MPILGTAAETSFKQAPAEPTSLRRKGYIERLGRYKLVWWRIGNDLFAVKEMIQKTQAAIEKASVGSFKQKSLSAYLAALQTRQGQLERREQRVSKIMRFRMLDTLPEREYQWWRRMKPVYKMQNIPPHLEYWLGTTEKSSVGYTRIAGPKLDTNGKLLWQLDTSFYFDAEAIETLPTENRLTEWSYNPVCQVSDVEQEVFGKEIPF